MAVYLVRPAVERYASLELASHGDYGLLPVFDGHLLQMSEWPTLSATLGEGVPGNFAYVTSGTVACDARAREVILRSVPDGSIQFLPLLGCDYHLANVVRVVNCLDHERSEFRYFPSSRRVYRILRHVFREEQLGGALLFKLPETARVDVYASEGFRRVVEASALEGLSFEDLC